MNTELVRERRARRKANRLGYRVTKSRARNPRDVTFGGYMLADMNGNVVAGGQSPGYTLDRDQAETLAEALRHAVSRSWPDAA